MTGDVSYTHLLKHQLNSDLTALSKHDISCITWKGLICHMSVPESLEILLSKP